MMSTTLLLFWFANLCRGAPTLSPTRIQFYNCTAECKRQMASFYHIYNRSIEKTHRIGARQKNASMFPDQFKIEGCTINPALIRWPFGQWRNYSKQSIESMGLPSSPTFLVTYCQGHFCFFQIYQRFQGVGWRSVKKPDILEVLIPEQSNKRARFNRALSPELDGPFVWGDMRFYFDEMNQTRTIYYVKDHKRRHSPFVPWTDVFVYDKGIDSFHTGSRGNKLDISNHTRPQQEKNWSPFTYNSTSFFVYSISPVHRIVGTASRGFEPGNEQGQDVVFAYETPNEVQWDWGELRGGTPARASPGHKNVLRRRIPLRAAAALQSHPHHQGALGAAGRLLQPICHWLGMEQPRLYRIPHGHGDRRSTHPRAVPGRK